MSLLLCVSFLVSVIPVIKSSVLYKCSDFHFSGPKAEMGREHDNGSHTIITIPSHLMSHFQPYEFRMVSGNAPICDVNYDDDVIKISLIGRNITAPTSSSQQPIPVLDYNDIAQFPLLNDSNSNNNDALGPPSSKSKSHLEGFMYSEVENIRAISNTSYLEPEEEEQQTGEPQCERMLSREKVQFTPTGFLFHSEEYHRPEEFCIQGFNEDENWMAVRKCQINCDNESTPCIPLCCHLHEYIDLNVSCCQRTLEPRPTFRPVIYDKINRKLSLDDEAIDATGILDPGVYYTINKQVRPHYITFQFIDTCPDGLQPDHLFFNEDGDSNYDTRIHIQNNGKLAYIGDDREWHHLEHFCVAGIVNSDANDALPRMTDMTTILYYCLESEGHPEIMWPFYMYIGVFSISSFFLLLIVIVYLLLWDKQNIHGWTILSFVTSEFLLFVFLTMSYSLGVFVPADETSKSTYCVGSAILGHFFFLSTFTWLTIVNLDLWLTFRNFTPISERSKGKKRFCLYMLFAWGIPTTVVSTGLILQHIYRWKKLVKSSNEHFVLVPDYGNRSCFLSTHAQGVYLYYIIGVLLLINFILITCTVVTLYKFKKSARIASTSSSRTKERSFKLFVKLVVVMGVTWSLEFAIWLIHDGASASYWLMVVVDVFNVLQAVATFVIFVCKKKILNQLEQKHPFLTVITKPILRILANRAGTMITSSTASKQTRSTTMNSAATSSVLNRNLRKSQKVSMTDSKL